jgi:hypothetical protein
MLQHEEGETQLEKERERRAVWNATNQGKEGFQNKRAPDARPAGLL